MQPITEFIKRLSTIMNRAFHSTHLVPIDQRKRHSEYLDHISKILAETAAAIQNNENLSKHFGELRYHISTIGYVLRLGDPNYLMSMSDNTVSMLIENLDEALNHTDSSKLKNQENPVTSVWVEKEELKGTLLNASGVFRGVAVSLRAMDKKSDL